VPNYSRVVYRYHHGVRSAWALVRSGARQLFSGGVVLYSYFVLFFIVSPGRGHTPSSLCLMVALESYRRSASLVLGARLSGISDIQRSPSLGVSGASAVIVAMLMCSRFCFCLCACLHVSDFRVFVFLYVCSRPHSSTQLFAHSLSHSHQLIACLLE
jgi:hypothetical protein